MLSTFVRIKHLPLESAQLCAEDKSDHNHDHNQQELGTLVNKVKISNTSLKGKSLLLSGQGCCILGQVYFTYLL